MSSGKLNIQRNVFLEKEELDKLQEFISNEKSAFLFKNSTSSWGIVVNPQLLGNDFLVESGTNLGTIKIANDCYALDSDMNLIFQRAIDNIEVTAGNWHWVKISFAYNKSEDGVVGVSAEGQLTGSGTSFLTTLRGQITNKPTRVRFYKEDSAGIEILPGDPGAAINTDTYEVVQINSDTSAVISGGLQADTGLRYVVVGAYTVGTTLTDDQKEGIYDYNSCKIELIQSTDADTEPESLTSGQEFWLAAVYRDPSTSVMTITDKRSDYWRVNFGDILVTGFANQDGDNITNFEGWISKLGLDTRYRFNEQITTVSEWASYGNDVNNITTPKTYYCDHDGAGVPAISNVPVTSPKYEFVLKVTRDSSSNCTMQEAFLRDLNRNFVRRRVSSSWSPWVEITLFTKSVENQSFSFASETALKETSIIKARSTTPTAYNITLPDRTFNIKNIIVRNDGEVGTGDILVKDFSGTTKVTLLPGQYVNIFNTESSSDWEVAYIDYHHDSDVEFTEKVLVNNFTGDMYYQKNGRVATVHCQNITRTDSNTLMAVLPDSLKPATSIYTGLAAGTGTYFTINISGEVRCQAETFQNAYATLTYITEK